MSRFGDRVRVECRKWVDDPHWEFDAMRLGEDEHGVWLGVAKGTHLSRPGAAFDATHHHVVLAPYDAWFLATFYGDQPGRPVDVYVDIATPCEWRGDVLRAVDLDLDVIRGEHGRAWVDDEDEFAEHRVSLGYPDELVREASRSCAEVLSQVEDRTGPFDGVATEWLARLDR